MNLDTLNKISIAGTKQEYAQGNAGVRSAKAEALQSNETNRQDFNGVTLGLTETIKGRAQMARAHLACRSEAQSATMLQCTADAIRKISFILEKIDLLAKEASQSENAGTNAQIENEVLTLANRINAVVQSAIIESQQLSGNRERSLEKPIDYLERLFALNDRGNRFEPSEALNKLSFSELRFENLVGLIGQMPDGAPDIAGLEKQVSEPKNFLNYLTGEIEKDLLHLAEDSGQAVKRFEEGNKEAVVVNSPEEASRLSREMQQRFLEDPNLLSIAAANVASHAVAAVLN